MDEYSAGGVLGLLSKNKSKKSEASQLFAQDEKKEETVRQSLEVNACRQKIEMCMHAIFSTFLLVML